MNLPQVARMDNIASEIHQEYLDLENEIRSEYLQSLIHTCTHWWTGEKGGGPEIRLVVKPLPSPQQPTADICIHPLQKGLL